MRKLFALVTSVAVIVGVGASTALAGEVTGSGKGTPIRSYVASSICSFSGLEDWTRSTAQPPGPPEGIAVTPGVTQTPHAEGGSVNPPGVAGFACRGYKNQSQR
jgi:hypothetical protein